MTKRSHSFFKKLLLVTFLPISLLGVYYASLVPQFIESFYSMGIYPVIGQSLSFITGFLSISIAEFLVIFLAIFLSVKLIVILISSLVSQSYKQHCIKKSLIHFIMFVSIGYFCFITVWGLNYHRLSFAEIAHLNTKPTSISELVALCESLISHANKLRNKINEDERGVMYIPYGPSSVFQRASIGYSRAAKIYPELGGRYSNPKGVIFSKLMCYAGISGIYFPFTAEANINILIPHSMLPCTTCHEMAHQRGFAKEDEANYIAYLTCNLHPDVDFQYSGTLLGLIHAMNALYVHDSKTYYLLYAKYSEGVKRDLFALRKFWQQYEGAIEQISSKLNNAYLKSNMQEDGIYSYGRMVDLLIAEHRQNKLP